MINMLTFSALLISGGMRELFTGINCFIEGVEIYD